MVEIKIATPKAKISAIRIIGIDHNISHPKGKPSTVRIIIKTNNVGMNLKNAMTVADTGNIMRGKAVLRIKR